jgi:hypothetical protein
MVGVYWRVTRVRGVLPSRNATKYGNYTISPYQPCNANVSDFIYAVLQIKMLLISPQQLTMTFDNLVRRLSDACLTRKRNSPGAPVLAGPLSRGLGIRLKELDSSTIRKPHCFSTPRKSDASTIAVL